MCDGFVVPTSAGARTWSGAGLIWVLAFVFVDILDQDRRGQFVVGIARHDRANKHSDDFIARRIAGQAGRLATNPPAIFQGVDRSEYESGAGGLVIRDTLPRQFIGRLRLSLRRLGAGKE